MKYMNQVVLEQNDFIVALKMVIILFVGPTLMSVALLIAVASSVSFINLLTLCLLIICLCFAAKLLQFTGSHD